MLGVRPECVSNQRGKPWKGDREWASDGCAASSFNLGIGGPVLAFRGPIEAQGRGSLHPHVLVWLVAWDVQRVFNTLLRDKQSFQQRVTKWQSECIAAILSVTQSSVQHLPARFGFFDQSNWGPAVPWTKEQHSEFTTATTLGERYSPDFDKVAPCLVEKEKLLGSFPTERSLFDSKRSGCLLCKTCSGFACSSTPGYRILFSFSKS